MKDEQISGSGKALPQQQTPRDEKNSPTSDPNKSETQHSASKGEAKLILPPKGWRFVPMSQVEHLLTPRQRRLMQERTAKKANRALPNKQVHPTPLFGYLNQDDRNPELPSEDAKNLRTNCENHGKPTD